MKRIQIEELSSDELLLRIKKIIGDAFEDLNLKSNPKEYKLLTKAETAEMFSISIRSLHNWNQNGILKPITIGNRVYYRSDEVEQTLIANQ